MVCWQQAKMLYKYRGSLHTRMRTHTPPDEQNQSSGTAELRVTGDHQGFKIHVKWDPATPNDKKVGRTIELWRDRNGREMVPMQLCTPDTEHLTGTEYTSEVHSAWPLPQPQKRDRKAPAAQGVNDLLDA